MRNPQQRKPLNDLSRSLIALDANHTLIAVIEMGQKSWLVAGIVPGLERQPLKKLDSDENALLKLLDRWRMEAERAGHKIKRLTVAFEAGRDGFWLARWLRARGVEAHVIHASSVAVSREHRRAKTDRLDTELLKRAFLGWLRGERDHCKIGAPSCTKCQSAISSLRAKATIIFLRESRAFSVRVRYHRVKALSFWNWRKRQANWINPRRTRALPARASPFSRRLLPLSSGEPVRPPRGARGHCPASRITTGRCGYT